MRTLGCILKGPPAVWRINGLAGWKVDDAADGWRKGGREREVERCGVDCPAHYLLHQILWIAEVTQIYLRKQENNHCPHIYCCNAPTNVIILSMLLHFEIRLPLFREIYITKTYFVGYYLDAISYFLSCNANFFLSLLTKRIGSKSS